MSAAAVDENVADGTVVSTLSASDPDAGDSVTFTLLDDAGGRFVIVGNELRVTDGSLLDFDAGPSHNITLRVTDSGGLTFDKTISITVNDVLVAIDLSTVALGIGGFKITGEAANGLAGYSVSSAGDMNGDGFDDLIVGASRDGAGEIGAAYVIFGAASGITSVNLDDIAAGNGGFKIIGESAGDWAGRSVSSAGDVNGDGVNDLIVGAPNNAEDGIRAGAAYVVFGAASGIASVNLADIASGNGGFKIIGEMRNDSAGGSVSSAGDVNGDGFDDLVIGARGNDSGGNNVGAAYVVFGKASGFNTNIILSELALGVGGFKITGEAVAQSGAGYSVSSAGDMNGDGFDDVIIGAWRDSGGGFYAGAAYVVFGAASGIASVNLADIASGTGGFKITGEAIYDQAGFSVSSAGDVNGDGFNDLIVGADQNIPVGLRVGAAYVVFGAASGIASVRRVSEIRQANRDEVFSH